MCVAKVVDGDEGGEEELDGDGDESRGASTRGSGSESVSHVGVGCGRFAGVDERELRFQRTEKMM